MVPALSTLPNEVLFIVSEYLTIADLARLAATSRNFARISYSRLCHWAISNVLSPAGGITEFTRLKKCFRGWRSGFVTAYLEDNSQTILELRDWRQWSILHCLVAAGNLTLLSCLLPKCVDISLRDEKGETPLHLAVRLRNEIIVRKLLEAGADVLEMASGKSILALVRGEVPESLVQVLIGSIRAAGGDISDLDHKGQTPLHYASRRGDERLAKLLIANGADTFAPSSSGHVPLVWAALNRHVGVSKILLEKMTSEGAYDINAPIPSLKNVPQRCAPEEVSRFYQDGDTLLHRAVGTWNAPIIQLLLDYGADSLRGNHSGPWGSETPFDIAVRGRAPDIVETIIAGTRPAPEFWYSTGGIQDGFETCVREAYPGTVRALTDLLEAGKVDLDVNRIDISGGLPMLTTCTYFGGHVSDRDIHETVKCVVNAGADVNAKTTEGASALHLLCQDAGDEHDEAKMKLMIFLLDAGADWRIMDKEGNTAFHTAAKSMYEPVIKHILAMASSPEDRRIIAQGNSRGDTALYLAAREFYATENRGAGTMELLISAQLNPNMVNNDGQTLAHIVVIEWEFGDAIQLLPRSGADMSLRDYKGNTPLHYVLETMEVHPRWVEMCRYLESVGAAVHEGCEQCAVLMVKYAAECAERRE